MITEDYVSFETAKLLKEKGFWENCPFSLSKLDEQTGEVETVRCPTLQMAMKWLREEKDVQIEISVVGTDTWESPTKWMYGFRCQTKDVIDRRNADFSSYEEACEAAIKYCLKNLIKNEDKEEESEILVPKTVDEAISTLEKILSDEDREYLLENRAISMHDSLGRWIRNEWGLWTGSELKDELMNMNKGLNHPDDMSNYIIEEFIKYWNNKL